MSQKGPRHGRSRPTIGEKNRKTLEGIDETNPVMKMFLSYRKELDDKHDRYEKIIKLSRDITIETKRVIFSLHSTYTDITEKKQSVMDEAFSRLKQTGLTHFRGIAELLKGHDHYQYQKAYTGGLQEFIEALTFYYFLNYDRLEPYNSIQKMFSYEEDDIKSNVLFPHMDYILGIADFTGELMRRSINNLGIGNINECFRICNVVKDIYTGFLGLVIVGNKELSRKIYVLKQSLSKMELVCYNIQIRGSEIPKHMLVSVIESNDVNADEDEGYY